MSKAKLAALLLVSFVATASVVYQIKYRKPAAAGVVVGEAPAPAAAAASANAPVSEVMPSATPAVSEDVAVAHPDRDSPRPNIPATGWRRNPFLTIEEEKKLSEPSSQPVAQEKAAPKPVETTTLPSYTLTGIISGSMGNWAIIDDHWSLRTGSRLGLETVKEVKDRSVVLDHQGHLRELRLKSIEDTAAGSPKKEEKK